MTDEPFEELPGSFSLMLKLGRLGKGTDVDLTGTTAVTEPEQVGDPPKTGRIALIKSCEDRLNVRPGAVELAHRSSDRPYRWIPAWVIERADAAVVRSGLGPRAVWYATGSTPSRAD
ncbi:MAG: hypothetical protein SGI92_26300 [Bryobacteraceae bacterium]|nr:hypothetical protein [Bryobacteraceae bacterium]